MSMNIADNNIERGIDQSRAMRLSLIKCKNNYFEEHVRRIDENDTENEGDENSDD